MLNIAVIGSAQCNDQMLLSLAKQVGEEIARSGHRIITGACGGIPGQAEQAAANLGGQVLGISPALNEQAHIELGLPPRQNRPTIWTGRGFKGRNIVMIEDYADLVVMINGGLGTLNEALIALDKGSTVYVFHKSGGAAGALVDLISNLKPSLLPQIKPGTALTI